MKKKKENFILKIYALTLTAVLIFFFIKSDSDTFEEITVERINIVEPNGDLKMVLSNQSKQHSGMFDGKVLFEERQRPPGIIFFNEEQDEVGGLLYQGNKQEGASWILSVDQYKTDQVMQMRYLKNQDGQSKYGIQFWDKDEHYTMPFIAQTIDSLKTEGFTMRQAIEHLKSTKKGTPLSAERMFVGKTSNKSTGIFIQDQRGIDRLKIYVDQHDNPKIEVLDNTGKVIKNLAIE